MQVDNGGADIELSQGLIDLITEQQVAAGVKSTDPEARIGSESASQANARITAGYRNQPKPELTQEGASAGATINWVRTGAGGVGEYKEVFPIGAPIPTERTTTSGNVYDAQGNLISGTGLKTSATTSTTTKTNNGLPAGFTAGPFPKELEQLFGSSAGVLGYKIITNPDGSQQLEVSDAPGSSKTFGAKFQQNASGTFTPVSSTSSSPTAVTSTTPTTVIPGSTGSSTTGGPSLAVNTFKNTLSLFFGTSEMSKPWVDELYRLVNPYYKSGSSVDEALNLAIQEGRKNPALKEFTDRFKGIYDLQDKLLKGVAVTVPTIAEFIASEAKMGDVLNQAGLSSLNQQSYLGDIIGKGINVTEFTNRVNNVFLRIDQLPQQAKDFISGTFPTLDKTSLAKAILGGEKGAIQLSKELSGMEVQAAFKAQGLGVDTATGLDIASRGFGYQEALTGAGTVAQSLPTYEKLQEISSGKDVKTSQAQAELQGMVFNKSIVDSLRAQELASQEVGRFSAKSGNIGSKAFASQARGSGLI
jgi:hypothetical protein